MSDRAFRRLRHEWAWLTLRVSIAVQVRTLRRHRGWTRHELAIRAGLHYGTVLRIECGGVKMLDSLIAIAHACDVALLTRFCSWPEFASHIAEMWTGQNIPSFSDEDAVKTDAA